MNRFDKMAFKLLDLANTMVESEEELLVYKQFLRTATDQEIEDEFYGCGFLLTDINQGERNESDSAPDQH